MAPSRYERTHDRLARCALGLFESTGFETTTVAQIAEAAGVTEMTFFRHYASKEMVVLTDPYDPLIADVIAAQPRSERPMARAVRGIRHALGGLEESEMDDLRRRVRIIASSPTLRARSVAVNAGTETRIGDQLIADGAPALVARVVAAVVLAALTAALVEWARDEGRSLPEAIDVALRTLEDTDE